MKKLLFITVILVILFSSCKKDGGKGCWQAWDGSLFETSMVYCDITKDEAKAAHPQFLFCKVGEQKYCWRANQTGNYFINIPQTIMEEWGSYYGWTFTKVECNSFCICQWLEKRKSKITGQYTPNQLINESFSSSDTCSKLYIGRIIVVNETSDSIITRELTSKMP